MTVNQSMTMRIKYAEEPHQMLIWNENVVNSTKTMKIQNLCQGRSSNTFPLIEKKL